MTDTRVYLDPTGETQPVARALAARPASLDGAVVGLLDISKPTFTKVAPVDLRHEIATQCDVVVEALAD